MLNKKVATGPPKPFGFLNADKPPGPTSHDIVDRVRRLLPRKCKAGHAGTLDPFAGGVMVLCIGQATRLAEYVQVMPKEYLATVTLGITSTTGDPEGSLVPVPGASPPAPESVRKTLEDFTGEITQVPPRHSAIHVDGRRAYQLARNGRYFDLPVRDVGIYAIELIEFEYPRLQISVRCGSGTYIRSLAEDIGRSLGCGGYCSRLKRIAVGSFTADKAVGIDDIDLKRDLLEPLEYLEIPRLDISETELEEISHGHPIPLQDTYSDNNKHIALVDHKGQLAAVCRADIEKGKIKPMKVFCSPRNRP